MSRNITLNYKFVEYIPDQLEDGTIYISMTYATAAHRCCCGCGNEVITPLSPTDWALTYDGMSISLNPSIGNWNFVCKSHYWIIRNKVRWAQRWSVKDIASGRFEDSLAKKRYFDKSEYPSEHDLIVNNEGATIVNMKNSFWQRLRHWLNF